MTVLREDVRVVGGDGGGHATAGERGTLTGEEIADIFGGTLRVDFGLLRLRLVSPPKTLI